MKRNSEKVAGLAEVELSPQKSPKPPIHFETSSIAAEMGNSRRRSASLPLVLLCGFILIAEIALQGESLPVVSVVSGKGQRAHLVFPNTKSLKESLQEAENNGRRGMNNSKSSSRHVYNGLGEDAPARADKGTDDIDILLVLASRRKRGYFDDKEEERERMEETYYKSFRLFWFLGGVAIIFFILIFILTLLCFCCPNLAKPKRDAATVNSIPRISLIPSPGEGIELSPVGLDYQPSPCEVRSRSPSVYSANNALYVSHHRLSQEQVNMIQLQSQTRRNSNLPSTSQGLLPPSSALIDVNVIQEYKAEPC